MIVGLDLATTSGIALYDDDEVKVTTYKGTPIELLTKIESYLKPGSLCVIEEHKHFRNAKTTRSLLERNGFIFWSLVAKGYEVQKLFPGKGRLQLIKAYHDRYKLTKDEVDAIALINFHLQVFEPLKVSKL